MPDPKRVILIMTDSQRKDMVGCYGNADMKTPNLDRLAAEGIRFERAYCCQPVCGPARSAMFTGTFPHSSGVTANSVPLGDNVKTVGQRLDDNGVRTAYIGKWHLDGGDYFGVGRCPEGWDPDYWYDMRNYLEELTEDERVYSRQLDSSRDPNLKADFTFGHRCSDRAVDFLETHGAEDFLLVVSYDEPHGPFLCPGEYADMYRDYCFPKSRNVWDTLEDKPAHHQAWAGKGVTEDKDALLIRYAPFFGCNTFIDTEIGRVLDAIDRHAGDALVIYTSDHGDALHSHCLGGKGPAMYDEITNIPFLVRRPGHTPAQSVSSSLVSHIDLVPTIMHHFELPIPKILEGRDMSPVFSDPARETRDMIFMEFHRYEIDHDGFGGFQPIRSCFDGHYKLVVNLLTSDELYDLQSDPDEMKNLILSDAHLTIRDRLHDRLLEWMNETRDPFRGYYWERRPWRENARPATWDYTEMTRQRENEEYEPRQLDYGTGLPITKAARKKDE